MDIKNDLGSEAPCRSGRIRVETRDSANSCLSGDCQMLSSTVAVQFLDCPDTPTEEVTIEEITPGCRPRLHLDPEAEHIPPGTRSPMTTRLILGCREMPTQTVNFEITGVPAAMDPNSATTDEDGLVHTDVVVGDEEGLITVTAQTEIIYSTMKVIFNGEVIQEEQKTENVTESVDLYVFQDPEMSLSVSPDLVAPGDSAAVNVEIHRNDVPVENAMVNMQVVGPVTLAASSGTTDTDGALTVGVTAGDSQGTATVTADSLVITELDDGNTISTALLAQADVTVLATGIGLYAMRDAFYLNHDEPVSAYVFSDGALLEDAVVEFSANNGNTVTPTTATADQWGHYNTTFRSSTEGAATVTARTTLNGTTYSNTLDLTVLDSSPQDYIGMIIGRVAKTATSSYIPSYEIDVQVDLAFTVDPSIDCGSNMVELDNIAGTADLSILSVTMHDGYPTADNPNYWIYEDFQVRSVAGITITGDATGYPDDPYSPPQMYLNFSIDSPPAFIQYTPVHMEYYEDSGYSRSEHDPEEIAFRSVDYSNQLDPQWDMLEWDTVGDADLSYLRIRTDDVVLQTDDYGSISIERVD